MSQQFPDHHEHAVKGSEVFVGGLPSTITESTIHELFSQCGEIIEVRLIKDQKGKGKGFGFIRFATKEAAEKAVKEKSGHVLNGKKVGVLPSIEQDTLYLGNLNKGWSANEFEGMVCQVFPDIVSVDLATPPGETQSGKQKNRGFAFVKFSSHAAAARALRLGSKPEFILGNLHPAVQWAEEQPETDPAVLDKIKIAFIRNLPASTDENFLKKLFNPFGEIEKVVLWRKGTSQVGFIHFTKRSDLENAIRGMHEKAVQCPKGGPTHKISVEVARPIDKSRKRAREDSEGNVANKIPSNLKNNPSPGVHSESPLSSYPMPNALKEMECEDPYEAAVLSLSSSVKERLLRILRLNIASRFDIDIQNVVSLKHLPESTAISVLDQFMLSGADAENKGVYLAGLISRHQVDKLQVGRSPGGLSRVGDLATRDVFVSSFSNRVQYPADDSFGPRAGSTMASFRSRVQLPVVDSLASSAHLSVPRSDKYVPRYSAVVSDYPISSRALLGRTKETSCSPLQLTSTASTPYERLRWSSQIGDVSLTRPLVRFGDMADGPSSRPQVRLDDVADHRPTHSQARVDDLAERPQIIHQVRIDDVADRPPTHPRVRFDPFTGEPYKFDPFTGERILPEHLQRRF